MVQNEPLVRIEHLSKTFEDGVDLQGAPKRIEALKDVSFEIFPGEFIGVVGENGSGKSTLIHCLGSFEAADETPGQPQGPILCRKGGELVDIQEVIDWYRQNFIGIVFQAFHLLPKMRVWQNVEVPLKLGQCERFTVDGGERRTAVREVLERLGMGHHFHSRVHKISGGQRQRVAIARALVKRPSLLLADEPTGNLDAQAKGSLVETLRGLADEGVAVLMVTHDRQYVDEFADRIITLHDGEIQSIQVNDGRAPSPSSLVHSGDGGKKATKGKRARQEAIAPVAADAAVMVLEESAAEPTPEVSLEALPDVDVAPLAVEPEPDDESPQPASPAAAPNRTQSTHVEDASTVSSLAAALLNPLKRIRIPGCDQRLHDLLAFSLRDAWESSLGLVTNVVAIVCGAVLTALLMGLLVGADRFIKQTLPLIPNIDAVHVWVDYSTGAEPLTDEEFAKFAETSNALAVAPNIQQFATLYKTETRPTIVTLASGVADDPEIKRLKLLKGGMDLDSDGWGLVINERVANDLDNFNPLGLVGKKVTLQLRRYERSDSPDSATPSEVLNFPVEIVGIVEASYEDRVYGSLNMVRFVRDYSTGRSKEAPPPEGRVDVAKISPRTKYEGVRLHFADPWRAETAYAAMKGNRESRVDVYWSGSEMEYLRDVQTVAFLVFLGIGLLTILAGSISVFNTLRASVAHKTNEIGILRALGVTRVDIFFIYIFQSLMIGVLAGIAGLLLAWLLAGRLNAQVFQRWEQLRTTLEATGGLFIISPAVALAMFVAVCLICVLAASFPAAAAARKTPMDALNQPGR